MAVSAWLLRLESVVMRLMTSSVVPQAQWMASDESLVSGARTDSQFSGDFIETTHVESSFVTHTFGMPSDATDVLLGNGRWVA